MTRFVLAALAAAMLAAPAYADCSYAGLGMLHAQINHNEWYGDAVNKALGGEARDFDFNYFEQCDVMLPIARKRLDLVTDVIRAHERMVDACPGLSDESPQVGGYSAIELRAILKEYVAVCGEEGD